MMNHWTEVLRPAKGKRDVYSIVLVTYCRTSKVQHQNNMEIYYVRHYHHCLPMISPQKVLNKQTTAKTNKQNPEAGKSV